MSSAGATRPGRRLLRLGAPIVIVLGLLVAIVSVAGWRQARTEREGDVALIGRSATSAFDRFVQARLGQLRAVAAAPALETGDLTATKAFLDGATAAGSGFLNYSLIGTNGFLTVISGPVQPAAPVDLRDRDFVQRILGGAPEYVGRVVPGKVVDELLVPLAVAVRQDGRLVGILGGGVRARDIASAVTDLGAGTDVRVRVVDPGGALIVGGPSATLRDVSTAPSLRALLAGGAPARQSSALDGAAGEVIAAATPVTAAPGWIVVTDEPTAVLYGPADAMLGTELAVDACVVLLALAALWWMARRLDEADAGQTLALATAERERTHAGRDRDRAAFLADASAVLHERLDRLATIGALARVAVPRFADFCAIDLFDADGAFVDARIAAADPRKVVVAEEVRRRFPHRVEGSFGVPAVFRTGIPEAILEFARSELERIPSPELRALVDGLGFRSYIAVPLGLPDGRRLGVLTVAMGESGRRFSSDDVTTVMDLGRRTAVALDHASLYAEAAARRDELDAVISAIDDGVLVADGDGLVRSQNPASVRVVGNALGRDLESVLGELDPVSTERPVRRATATGRYVLPVVFDTDDRAGTRIAVLRDVTQVLETEAARDTFVGMLSHELRTPITTILGTAEVIRGTRSEALRTELIDDLASETARLHRLVEDLLVLSRVEQGRLEIASEPVLVQRVIESELQRTRAFAPRVRVDIDAEPGLPPVLGDRTYIEQIVRNLANNSVKYAGEEAHLEVRLSFVLPGAVRVEFEDDGPGIPPDQAERVFDLYERLATTKMKPGSGIGLFVCRRLVLAMGGTITVARGRRGGACFQLTLPTAGVETDEADLGAGSTAAGSAPNGDPATELRATA